MKKIIAVLMVICFLFLCGCGRINYSELPSDALAFETGEYIDANDDDAGYITITYNGRTYMPYGTLGKTLKQKDIDKCIGYLVQDGVAQKDTRFFTLVGDDEENFLLEHYIVTTLMNQPNFLRAVDTKGKEISVPKYIDSLDYKFWNE
ncbi:MAG: hypothetical protein MJ168_07130 [Clostridia bacterium]|nr:hypothetical protein [Clostridia bacterium]